MNKIGEIKGAISNFRNDTTFLQLKKRWQTDFRLWKLHPYDAGRGYYSYTTNSPRVLADKIISLLSDAKLMITTPDEGILDDKQQVVANNVERFLYGSFNINDELLTYQTNMPSLRDMMAWYAVVRGAFAMSPYIYKDDKGRTIPELAIWDIYNVAYGESENGLSWAAYTYKISAKQAKTDFDIRPGTSDVEVIHYRDDEKYGLIVHDKWVKEPVKHELGYCPVYICRVGAMPPTWQEDDTYMREHIGESVFAPNRNIYPAISKTLSDYVTMVRRGVKVPIGFWSLSGDKTLEEDIFQVEKAAVVPLQVGEKLEPIIPPTMPQNTADIFNIMSGEVQRGGLSHLAMGELGFRLSGYAITQLQGSLMSIIQPFAKCLEKAYFIASIEFLKQYTKKKGLPAVEVRGRTSKNQPFGYAKVDKIKASDIEGMWRPDIKLVPVLPKDDAQNYQLAQLAREGEIPLLSDETIRTDLLGIPDADLENEKIARQWADTLIVNRLYDSYIGYLTNGNFDKAGNILVQLKQLMAGMAPERKSMAARQFTPTEREAMGTPGAGLPAKQTGLPARVSPPETQGGMPPGALNAKVPQSTEEEI